MGLPSLGTQPQCTACCVRHGYVPPSNSLNTLSLRITASHSVILLPLISFVKFLDIRRVPYSISYRAPLPFLPLLFRRWPRSTTSLRQRSSSRSSLKGTGTGLTSTSGSMSFRGRTASQHPRAKLTARDRKTVCVLCRSSCY